MPSLTSTHSLASSFSNTGQCCCPGPPAPQLKEALQSGQFNLSPAEVEQLAEQVGRGII